MDTDLGISQGLPFLCLSSWLLRGKGSKIIATCGHRPSMEPGGSAGEEATLGSQQLQGKMLHELLEAWPSDA